MKCWMIYFELVNFFKNDAFMINLLTLNESKNYCYFIGLSIVAMIVLLDCHSSRNFPMNSLKRTRHNNKKK